MRAKASSAFTLLQSPKSSERKTVLIWLCLVVFTIKALFLLVDHEPGFHFGDSGAYLATALIGWIPPDRSFTYGFLIRPFTVHFHSLLPLVTLQTFMSSIASIVTGFVLHQFCRASLPASVIFALLSAIEPLQLMSERYVMAEAAATFGFSLFTLACFYYLRDKSLYLLLLCQVIGVILTSLRFSFLPLVLLLSFLLPILGNGLRSPVRVRPLLISLFTSVLVSQTLLSGYRHLYGILAEVKPAYLSRDGEFLVADMAPLIKPIDFPLPDKRAQLFHNISIPLSEIDNRRVHRWLPGGICAAMLTAAGGDEEFANQLARKTAIQAMRRDPFGVINLALQTYGEFFVYRKIKWALRIDQGKFVEPTSNDIAMIEKWFSIDVSERRFHSLTQGWEGAAVPWCWFTLLLPFGYALEVVVNRHQSLSSDYLLLLMSFSILFAAIVPVEIANPRYLVPLPWLSVLISGVIHSRLTLGQQGTHKEL